MFSFVMEMKGLKSAEWVSTFSAMENNLDNFMWHNFAFGDRGGLFSVALDTKKRYIAHRKPVNPRQIPLQNLLLSG